VVGKMIVKFKVKPHSGEQSIENKGDYFLAKLKSFPEDNKANLELLKLLKKHFKKEVRIKSGFTSRNKTVEVLD